MFGGLTKTSSRIAIAAALGLTLGGFAFKATPAKAADLGGDCCADLEERVAELEATTVRKGNKKVSVTLSGWVIKSINYWDDGDIDHVSVGDKDADLSSRFAITGSATIAPGWSGGYNLTVVTDGDVFGISSNQERDLTGGGTDVRTLYSYIYIKSDKWGTLNWGTLSPASDNPAVLADISGTVIESNFVMFEGPGFFLRPNRGGGGDSGLANITWGSFQQCFGLNAGIGVDCFGGPQSAVRYDSPTWGGFRFETSYGENQGLDSSLVRNNFDSSDQDFWDIAVFYTGDWNSIKLSVAAAYTWIEDANGTFGSGGPSDFDGGESNLFQVGATIMHKPSGLGVYGMYQNEDADGFITSVNLNNGAGGFTNVTQRADDTNAWGVKPFWRKAWSPIGATVLFGEYGEYEDQFAGGALCGAFSGPGSNLASTNVGAFCAANGANGDVFVTDSTVQRWGLGVVQEIDSAAMHVWLRWQHQEFDDLGLVGLNAATGTSTRINQGFDEWDLIQAGGIIFF